MSQTMPDFRLIKPATIDEAVAALADKASTMLCAGGTDLIVNMRHGLVEVDALVDISAVAEMNGIEFDGEGVHLGAAVNLREIADNLRLAKDYPAITEAARAIAGPTHREVATLGGNLCLDTRCYYYNQSDWWRRSNQFCLKYKGDICHVAPKGNRCRAAFSGDLAPALLIHGAAIDIVGKDGKRRMPLVDLYVEDGTDYLTLADGEMITKVHLPPSTAKSSYQKVRVRGSIDFPLAGVAVACENPDKTAHSFTIALTGTNSCPVMVGDFDPLTGDDDPDEYFALLVKKVQKTVSPQRTTTTAAHYRRLSIANVAARVARRLCCR